MSYAPFITAMRGTMTEAQRGPQPPGGGASYDFLRTGGRLLAGPRVERNDPQPGGLRDGLEARVGPELAQDRLHVRPQRRAGDAELLGCLVRRGTFRQVLEDLQLARRERLE